MSVFQWLWQTDDGFIEYAADKNIVLEDAYQAGLKEVPVDSERLVDFKHMLQRRIDDRNKRRAVERDVTPGCFEGKTIALLGFSDEAAVKRLTRNIAACEGALVAKRVHRRVDCVVVEDDWEKNSALLGELKQAQEWGLPILRRAGLEDAVQKRVFPPESNEWYVRSIPFPEKKRGRAFEGRGSGSNVLSESAQGKGKEEEDDDDDKQEKEQQKKPGPTETKPELQSQPPPVAPAPAAVRAAPAAEPPLKKPALSFEDATPPLGTIVMGSLPQAPAVKKPPSKPKAVGKPVDVASLPAAKASDPPTPEMSSSTPTRDIAEGAALWKEGSEWSGVAVQDGAGFPFVLHVTSCDANNHNNWTGLCHWPTLLGMTRVRGTRDGLLVTFTEEVAIYGGENVEVGAKYDILFSSPIVGEGKLKGADGSVGTVHVRLAKEGSSCDILQSGTVLEGVMWEPVPFKLTIDARIGNKVSGTIKRGANQYPFSSVVPAQGQEFQSQKQDILAVCTKDQVMGVFATDSVPKIFFLK